MSGSELKTVIESLRRFGLRVPKSVTSVETLVAVIDAQTDGEAEEEEVEEETPAPLPNPGDPKALEMSSTTGMTRREREEHACVAEQAALAKKHSAR